jgi:hypothetical protein
MRSSKIVGVLWFMNTDNVTRLVPGAGERLGHLSNEELLRETRYLVGKANQVVAALLEHLAEVEARGLYRLKACANLYTYCIYELRFSEDAASRRASAARLVRQFPAALEAIAKGELHLTGLLQLGPVMTDTNHLEVLARAKFRTKKEIARLVRRLAPLPEIPDRIEPTGATMQKSLRSPTWAQFVESLCPPVRELKAGDRPSDWANDADVVASEETAPAPARQELATAPTVLPPLDEPQLYQMQFTTTEEHTELVERAKALLSHQSAKVSLGELHLQAMRLLVENLEKKRFGARQPRAVKAPRQRGRSIPTAVRRAVFERDEAMCTFVDDRGVRCRETHLLELDHVVPYAKGGRHTLANLRLRCAAHNALAAEDAFGREEIQRKRDCCRHFSRRKA